MGQNDILNFLEKHPNKWFTAKEIMKGGGGSSKPPSKSLSKLRRFNLVEFKMEQRKGTIELLFYKHKKIEGD